MMKNEFEIAKNELQASLVADLSGGVPEVIELIPLGEIKGKDGREFYLNDAQSVIDKTNATLGNTDILIDYNHQSEYAKENGRPAPAAGWIKEFFVKEGVLSARVEWTGKAFQQIKNKEFRYLSPVFYHKEGEISQIISAALTNQPNLGLKALNQSQLNNTEVLMNKEEKALCQALAVPDEEQALSRISELQKSEKALNEICSQLQCDKSSEAVLKAVNEKEADLSKYVALNEFSKLTREFENLKKERQTEKALNAVDTAIKDGKLPPALKENGTAFGGKVTGQAFGVSIDRPARFNYAKLKDRIKGVAERLTGVTIERLDFETFIKRYDTPETLFYLDPPYWDNETDYGKGIFNKEDFKRLKELLKNIKGGFILSLNDKQEVRKLFKDFNIKTVPVTYSVNKTGCCQRTELIISN